MTSIRSKITKLCDTAPGAIGELDSLVHDRASNFATNTNNEGIKAQLEFLNGHGMSDEAILQYLEEGIAP